MAVEGSDPVPVVLTEPWWARAITRWGLGTVLAIYLVYIIAGQLLGRLDQLNTNLVAHMASQDTMKELLAQVCSNTAKTDDERTFCFDITMRAEKAAELAVTRARPGGGGQ